MVWCTEGQENEDRRWDVEKGNAVLESERKET